VIIRGYLSGMRKPSSFTWLTLVAGLALGLTGLRQRVPGYRSLAANRFGVEHEIPAPRVHDLVRLRLAPPLRTERGGAGDSVWALSSSSAAFPNPGLAAQLGKRLRIDASPATGERLPYFPTGPPLSM
jgi:hypothetical protein